AHRVARAALREVLAAGRAGGTGERLAEELRRELVDLEELRALAARAHRLGRRLHLGNGDAALRGQDLRGLVEALALVLHHEGEDVALLVAPEAVEEALVGRDVERRRL